MVSTEGILTADTVPDYIRNNLENLYAGGLAKVEDPSVIQASTIAGGNVNYAFCVQLGSNRTIFLKQAPEFVAIFGPDGFPLTSDRMQHEMDVYAEWKAMLSDKPYLPQIYHFDKSIMVVVMEFLEGHELLDHVLVDPSLKSMDLAVAKGLGEFMGVTHAKTHSSLVSNDRQAYLTNHFENKPMRDVQLEFVFTKCYKESTAEQREGLNLSDEFLQQVETMKNQYSGKETDNLVLCHGDLHPGSVMVNEASVKVIDPEFTVYGPPGLDVGSLMSGYVLGTVHQVFCENPVGARAILAACKSIWESYVAALKANGIAADAMIRRIAIETVGFTVAEVCRTAMEFAGGRKWLQFEDGAKKKAANKAALQIVDKCMIVRHERGVDVLWEAMEQALL